MNRTDDELDRTIERLKLDGVVTEDSQGVIRLMRERTETVNVETSEADKVAWEMRCAEANAMAARLMKEEEEEMKGKGKKKKKKKKEEKPLDAGQTNDNPCGGAKNAGGASDAVVEADEPVGTSDPDTAGEVDPSAAGHLPLADVPGFAPCRESTIGGETTCTMCFTGVKDHLAVPCGHRCACERCAEDLQRREMPCPICRKEVIMWVRVHDA